MKYLLTKEIAELWNVKERNVRNYLENDRVPGAILKGKTWYIPEDAKKPERLPRVSKTVNPLVNILKFEKEREVYGSIYEEIQVLFCYNSSRLGGPNLTIDEMREAFKNNQINSSSLDIDDVFETLNHFRAFDFIIDSYKTKLNESYIKGIHYMLESNTKLHSNKHNIAGTYRKEDSNKFRSDYVKSSEIKEKVIELLSWYNSLSKVEFEHIVEFHARLSNIHPFSDANGRVGRLIMFKECLKNGITPILIEESFKQSYYKGIEVYDKNPGTLEFACSYGQDTVSSLMDDFKINY